MPQAKDVGERARLDFPASDADEMAAFGLQWGHHGDDVLLWPKHLHHLNEVERVRSSSQLPNCILDPLH